ncbi:MAG: hypothetical protein Q7R93_03230 [bacterium]|nr:hypothetical protein [bacterium]
MWMKRISLLLIALAVAYGTVAMATFPKGFTIDDAFITFRYAENLAQHGELNWNVGENPVEGYTGVALPVLIAGFIKVGVSPLTASRIIGVVSFWVGFLMLFLIGRRMRIKDILTASMLLLYVTTPILMTHAYSGMETMLFLAVMLSSLFALIARKDRALLALLLLTSLVRPEGVAFSILALLSVGYDRYRTGRQAFKSFMKDALILYVLPALVYFVWRFSYYGRLLPNTFYAKSDVGFQPHVLVDIARFLRSYFAVPLLGATLLFVAETDRLWETLLCYYRDRKTMFYIIAGALFSLVVIAMLSRTHLIMNFSHRFYTMLFPIAWVVLLFIFQIGYASVAPTAEEKPFRFKFVLFAFAALIAYQSLFQVVKVRDEFTFARREVLMQRDAHSLIGKTLNEIMDPKETIISYMDAGAVSYFSKLRVIDFGALNDEQLARYSMTPGERIDYFFAQNAGAIVFTSEKQDTLENGEEVQRIIHDPRFSAYALYKRYAPEDTRIRYYEFVYLRKDIAAKML